jgi:hypothetical protein
MGFIWCLFCRFIGFISEPVLFPVKNIFADHPEQGSMAWTFLPCIFTVHTCPFFFHEFYILERKN